MKLISKILLSLTLVFLLASCVAPITLQHSTPTPGRVHEQTSKTGTLFTVIYHPDGPLYVGDQVSIEVLSPPNFTANNQNLRVSLGDVVLGETTFGQFGIGGRQQATLYWVWDTRALESGPHTLTFSILPAGTVWTKHVLLLPATDVPLPEPGARWMSAESDCCVIHYVSGTDAERDIAKLKAMSDAQAASVTQKLGKKLTEKIPLTFLPRVLGQGGFASSEIYVSYLDQNYAGSTSSQVVHHEMVHWFDAQIGAQARLAMLQEGLAVYLSDGHFKVEPIPTRAAALLQMERYIPLRELVDSFYNAQHEIGYLEGAALAHYMVKTYGWEKYNHFYRNLKASDNAPNAEILNTGLKTHFDISLDQLETGFIAFLREQTVTENDLTDLRLTIAFYDSVRRYQQMLDPSAHFMTAWLPSGEDVRTRGIVADYLRHPLSSQARQIENLLVAGDASLRAGDYKTAELHIRLVNMLLDTIVRTPKK